MSEEVHYQNELITIRAAVLGNKSTLSDQSEPSIQSQHGVMSAIRMLLAGCPHRYIMTVAMVTSLRMVLYSVFCLFL